jgi:PAS domain S-box-containing protein
MNARPLPIATALVIALVTIVTLVLGAFGGFIYWAESERRWDQLRQSLATNADRIAANLAVPIRALDDSQTTAIVRSATSDREIVAIEASTPRKRFAVGRDAQWLPVSVDALPTDADLLVAERNIDLDGTSIGRLKLFATSRFMEEELGAWRAAALGVGLLLDLALVLSLYGLLWTLVLRPVTAIERIAASVKHGGAETASHPNVWLVAELKDLRDSIKEMIGMLDSRYQALQASENRLRLATRAANIGVWDWDVTTNALVWDEEMCRQYGIRSEEFSGTYAAWANAVVPQDLEPAVDNIQAALRGEREFDSEFTIRRPDGSSRVIKGESMTIRDDAGRPLRMVGVNFDITEQRRAEQEIKTLNAELERRVRERTAQLEAAIDELARARDAAESATRAKSEFLANMSHEIRTPMNAVIGMTRLALRTRLSAKQQGYLTNAMAAAESLLGIINDILDFSKIEAGKLELESREFFLQDVLDKVTAVVGPKAREKGLEYLIDTAQGLPPSLVGDSLRLEQVLINLCTNAIKFTSAGEILVTLSAVEEAVADRAKIRFSVRDTGIGVSKDQMEGLFQPFNQLDTSTTRKYGGTGLGLAICKKLVTLMRGDIGVKSVPGEGSDFFFSAAFGIGTAVPKWASEAPFPVADRRVLVVDDSQSSRKILFDLLQSVGCRPVLVGSATDALAEIDRASAERP